MLKTRREDLAADLRRGSVTATSSLPVTVAESVDAWLANVAAARRESAAAALLASGAELSAKAVFPNLMYAMAIRSGSFEKYIPRLRRLLGEGVAMVRF